MTSDERVEADKDRRRVGASTAKPTADGYALHDADGERDMASGPFHEKTSRPDREVVARCAYARDVCAVRDNLKRNIAVGPIARNGNHHIVMKPDRNHNAADGMVAIRALPEHFQS